MGHGAGGTVREARPSNVKKAAWSCRRRRRAHSVVRGTAQLDSAFRIARLLQGFSSGIRMVSLVDSSG